MIGFNRQIFQTLPSTNQTAKELLHSRPEEGTIILAVEQTSGRGQMGTVWQTYPAQNLTFSVILYPNFMAPSELFLLSQGIAIGVLRALKELSPITEFSIKWPNDLLAEDAKIGGILIETQLSAQKVESAVVGIGLNVRQTDFPTNFARRPTSLALVLKELPDLEQVLDRVCFHLDVVYQQLLRPRRKSIIESQYLENLYRFNEWTQFAAKEQSFEGRIIGVDSVGRLLIETSNPPQTIAFDLKEIQFLQ